MEAMPIGEGFPQVLGAARTGAEWAWRVLYRDLAPVVSGYVRSRGAREPDDVCGEVFVEVARGLPRFEGDEAGFRSWVFVIAHHRLLDERRRARRHPEYPVVSEVFGAERAPEDVEATALDRISSERVREIIEQLTPDQCDVLLLRILGGLTVEEVARAVGKRPGAVKALQRRGLEAIRRLMQELGVTL